MHPATTSGGFLSQSPAVDGSARVWNAWSSCIPGACRIVGAFPPEHSERGAFVEGHLAGLQDSQSSLKVSQLQVEVALVLMQLDEGRLLRVRFQLCSNRPSHQPFSSLSVQLLVPEGELGQLTAANVAPASPMDASDLGRGGQHGIFQDLRSPQGQNQFTLYF